MEPNSFMSEHSAEYIITFKLCNYFISLHKQITPVYLFRTREGNSMGRMAFNSKIKSFVVYPRRPKKYRKDDSLIYFKINESILKGLKHYQGNGVPAYIGGPIINGLDEYNMDNNIFLAIVRSQVPNKNYGDVYINFDQNKNLVNDNQNIKIISFNNILRDIETKAEQKTWQELIQLSIEVNNLQNDNFSRLSFLTPYKPIIFIVRD